MPLAWPALRCFAFAVVVGLAACGPSAKSPYAKQVILDCTGPASPGSAWQDTYTVDIGHDRYCEASCGRIQSVHGSNVTIDLFGDHVHSTLIDLRGGTITAWERAASGDAGWVRRHGRCRRVNRSRYTRYD
jgi:hypothetical protein